MSKISVDTALDAFHAEYIRARQHFKPCHSGHEGYAVLLEEVEEMWDAIKTNNIAHARHEVVQVGAMALAFLLEIKNNEE